MPRKLRVVEPGEDKPRVLSVAEAAAFNDHRALLVALRDRVARSVEAANCPPVALAALSRQLTQLSKEISVLDARDGDSIDAVTQAALTADEVWDGVL